MSQNPDKPSFYSDPDQNQKNDQDNKALPDNSSDDSVIGIPHDVENKEFSRNIKNSEIENNERFFAEETDSAKTEDAEKQENEKSIFPNNAFTGFDESRNNSSESEAEGSENSMGLFDHLNELRWRLVKAAIAVAAGFGICWAFVDPLFSFLVNPLLAVLPEGAHAQYTTLPEAFFIRMQVAFVAGVFLASPIIFYQIWAFVAPGLYDEEKRYIVPIAFLSAIFFAGGAVFCYCIVFPYAFNFFISYSTPEILITPKISDYISFVLKLLFAFGLIFEMPIFTLFLSRMGIISASLMRKGRKYAIVGIFILAAILTPPDVISQLLMACPMLALYETSIGVAAIFGKKKTSRETESSDTEQDLS